MKLNFVATCLFGLEKLLGEEPVYRMASLTVDESSSTEMDFILPDGTMLLNNE